jgi:hypothetical protein
MLKTKTLLLPLLLAFLGTTLTAQTYVDAYYISLKGDTMKGTALLNSYTQMSKEIRFKSKQGEDMVLKPEAVKAVWLSPDRYFESHDLHFRNVLDQFDGVYFLRYVTKTDSLTLLKFEYEKYEGLYIQKKGENITPLHIIHDFVAKRTNDAQKQEVTSTDTLSYVAQMDNFGSVGQYKIRKPYLFVLYKYFDFCDAKMMNSTYNLTERDMKKAFQQSAKCLGRQNQIENYFNESPWKWSIGVTLNSQLGTNGFNYTLPWGAGLFVNYGDLRDGLSVGFNVLTARPKLTAVSRSNGSFREFFITYNRKLVVREKFNFGTVFGIAYLKEQGLMGKGTLQGTPFNFDLTPKEQAFYSVVGLSGSYKFAKNNYLTLQLLRNIYNAVDFRTTFGKVQVQYEYRF